MIIRPATAADFVEYNGSIPPYRVQAFVGEVDGKIVGMAGLAFPPGSPYPVAWADMTDDARRNAKTLHKTVKAFFEGYRGRVVCAADPTIPASGRWLKRLGFSPTGKVTDDGEVWAYVGHRHSD